MGAKGMFLIIYCLCMINEGQLLGSHIFDFHNLGYILRQVNTVTTYNAMAKLSFVIGVLNPKHLMI